MAEHWLAMLTRTLIRRESHQQGLSRKGWGSGRSMPAVKTARKSIKRKTHQKTLPPGCHGLSASPARRAYSRHFSLSVLQQIASYLAYLFNATLV